ncbi:MAG: hypothetical protein A2075_04680 [Geobacteraceae bacterium GWC2_58_44]|nr:MAG: hypothetical protein A2075_04680 [Geobacteraceae bacterium GWC2_58_44]HBG06642.1 hypothetical protein [Geobacter sp.]
MSAAPLVFVMTMSVAVVVVMPLMLFVMLLMLFGRFFPLDVDPAIPFDIVGASCVDVDMYSWRCRQVAGYADIDTGAWQPGRNENARGRGESGFGIVEGESKDGCGHYQHGKNGSGSHLVLLFQQVVRCLLNLVNS